MVNYSAKFQREHKDRSHRNIILIEKKFFLKRIRFTDCMDVLSSEAVKATGTIELLSNVKR